MAKRGIVTIADGPAYEACLWVLLRMLQRTACRLPVQVWGRPFPEVAGWVTEWRDPGTDYAVGNVRSGTRELKAVACLESGFDEVLFFDADAYPLTDPTPWLDWPELKEGGAVMPFYWRGVAAESWRHVGLEARERPGVDTFFMALDLRRRRADLERVAELGRTWRGRGMKVHGDCHLFQLGLLDRQTILPLTPHVHSVVVHRGEEDLLIHRGQDKWRLRPTRYAIRQVNDEMVRDRSLPLEDVAFGYFAEWAEAVGHRGFLPGFPWCGGCRSQRCVCKQETR